MLAWLYKLLITGFPPKCKHEFGEWVIIKSLTERHTGELIIF